jgi:ParB-like chromosome segregation protein Spo0J
MSKKIALSKIATFAECIEAVDMRKVNRLRVALRKRRRLPPIQVYPANAQGYSVIDDGNHRTMAHLLEGKRTIEAETVAGKPPSLSWRWPRIAPVKMTLDLFKAS